MPSPIPGLLINAFVWIVLAFGAGWWHRRTPVDQLRDDGFVLRIRDFERAGKWYESRLRIKSWKLHLPETGGRHGGMSKRKLPGRHYGDLARFAAECRRGERTHWTIVAASPTFALWNSYSAVAVITIANAAGNSPFIVILRYNRARLTSILCRRGGQPRAVGHGSLGALSSATFIHQNRSFPEGPVSGVELGRGALSIGRRLTKHPTNTLQLDVQDDTSWTARADDSLGSASPHGRNDTDWTGE